MKSILRKVEEKLRLVTWGVGQMATKGRPQILLWFGAAPGDDLLCTSVIHELHLRGHRGIWMASKHPALFEQNREVDAVVPIDQRYVGMTRRLGGKTALLKYCDHDWADDRDTSPSRHIIACLCAHAGITGTIAIRPYLQLKPAETSTGRRVERQVAIQTSASSAVYPMKNKEWFPDRFQQVVDGLKSRFNFVQVGSADDPPLHNVVDLRGKTSIREVAGILATSMMFIGLVGMLMHLARAVDCRSVIVYGGRELPWQSGYSCNENVVSIPPCSPCWRWNTCGYNRRCMDEITALEVVCAASRLEVRLGEPLELQTEFI